MPDQPIPHLSAEQSTRRASADMWGARLLDVDVQRPKRIDHLIDYFGSGGGRRTAVEADPCGDSMLDAAVSRFLHVLTRPDDGRRRGRRLMDGRRANGHRGRSTSRAWDARPPRADP